MPVPRLKQRLSDNDIILGAFVFSTDAAMAEIYAAAGFDYIIVDMEHGLNDLHSAVGHIRSGRGAGINVVVRLGASDYANVPRLLDAGCEGIVMPHLGLAGSGSDAALESMRYHPAGARPTCTGVTAASYGLEDFGTVVERSNRDVLSVGMIEDAACVERIDQVLAKRQVDWLMPGPADLSTSLGVHGQVRHPVVIEAVDKIFAAAKRHHLPVGMYINDPSEIGEWRAKGARFFILSIDLKWLARTLKPAAEKCRALAREAISGVNPHRVQN